MHPILYEIPAFPAWVGALLLLLAAGVFAFLARRDREKGDSGSWWLAGMCAAGAVALLVKVGASNPVGPLPIRWFGLLVVGGFLLGAKAMAARNTRLDLLTGEESFDLAFYVLLAGIAGARLVHVFQNVPAFEGRPHLVLAIWDGGLVWYGGLCGSTLFAWYWLAKRGKDLWAVSDSLAMSVPLAHAVGRIGCFLAGCDYGKPVPVAEGESPPWWAVHFPITERESLVPREFRYDPETDREIFLHPVQLYLALFNLASFAFLFWVDRKWTKGAFRGRLVALYLLTYAVGRATIEQWRGDADRGLYFGGAISFSQLVSAVVFVGGVLVWQGLKGRGPRAA
jgi:phosphatidylglycerol:prolipoprotein diacylglycerol transferase